MRSLWPTGVYVSGNGLVLPGNKPLPESILTSFMMTSSNGTKSALLAICAGNSPVSVNSPHKGQWRGALMFSLICARMNDWVNNREAGDLRRHRGHYDVSVMFCEVLWHSPGSNFTVSVTICLKIILFIATLLRGLWSNSSSPGQNGRHFADDVFECIFVN